jgi:N-acetylneuraminic acid mutarotase
MMGRAFETQRLPAGFTFRIIEAVKHVRINPVSTSNGVPWGLSLAAGLLCLALGLNPQFTDMFQVADLNPTIAGESSVAETGDFQIDIVKIPDDPLLQNAFFMAPQGEGGTWARREDMPDALWGSSASAVNDKIYVIGGGLDNNVPTKSVVEYDPATGKWTKKADMPTARGLLSTAVVNGKIYAIGGARFWEAVPDVGLSTVEEYDPVADKWTEKADMPTARYVHTSSVVDGKIYVIGGATVFSFVSAVEEYDPATDTWTKKANMPTATMLHSASVLNGRIYIMGGQILLPVPPSTIANSKVEEYDPVTDTWTEKADMSTARCLLASGVANGKIYAIGGYKDVWMGNPISLVEEYDPVTDKWTRKPDMPTPRYLIASSVVNGKIYIFGGTDTWLGWNAFGKPLSTVEEYTPESWQSVSPQGKKQNTWGKTKSF